MRIVSLALALALIGCNSAKSQLVGTWKGVQQPSRGSQNLGDEIGKSMGNLVASQATIEFNADGRYKISMFVGAQTGTYAMEGRKVRLKPDPSVAPTREFTLQLSADGKQLTTEKEFASDAAIVFEKR